MKLQNFDFFKTETAEFYLHMRWHPRQFNILKRIMIQVAIQVVEVNVIG